MVCVVFFIINVAEKKIHAMYSGKVELLTPNPIAGSPSGVPSPPPHHILVFLCRQGLLRIQKPHVFVLINSVCIKTELQ